MAKVLVIGSGGREHALVWKLSKSRDVDSIIATPGNAGIAQLAKCFDVKAEDTGDLAELAIKEKINLTVVGPEIPLVNGIVDYFEDRKMRIFGPCKDAASIEGSKIKAKVLMNENKIHTAEFEAAYDKYWAKKHAEEFLKKYKGVVIKADGLAAGKGVYVCRKLEHAHNAIDDIMVKNVFKFKPEDIAVVIEEPLEGEEASFIAFTDGKTVKPLASSQDHKPAYDNDQGPNTGGMGAYAPAPIVKWLEDRIMNEIMIPAIEGLAKTGIIYKGGLYAGLMITKDGPKVLEFNCRFGDPETQVNLPLLDTESGDDLYTIMNACIDGRLHQVDVKNYEDKHAVCVCIVSGGYPGDYQKGIEISGLSNVDKGTLIFHAGTKEKDGKIVTNGGRVLGITTVGADLRETIKSSYEQVGKIKFGDGFGPEQGKYFYRTDIGLKGLKKILESKNG